MILNPIKTYNTCVSYFEDDSTTPEYPNGYYQDDNFALPAYPSQTVKGRFVSTNKTVGTVKLRLSPREM